MADKTEKGLWIDPTGQFIPPKYIEGIVKTRDAMVERLHRLALAEQQRLAKFKSTVESELEKYLASLAADSGEDALNEGGNYILKNFTANRMLQVKIGRTIEFDERLNVAKQKIDRCLEKWSEGGNANLKVIVFDAFKVDQKGKVDTKRILGLRRHQIKDRDWQDAMELIGKAVTVIALKSYFMFQVRPNPDEEWQTIRLDLAGV